MDTDSEQLIKLSNFTKSLIDRVDKLEEDNKSLKSIKGGGGLTPQARYAMEEVFKYAKSKNIEIPS